ncbi:MAG: tetratricopeptide repeat protein [Armatimonadia bacterium]
MKLLPALAVLFAASVLYAQPQTFQQSWQEGNRLHSRGQYDEALAAYEAALRSAQTDQQRAQALFSAAKVQLARKAPAQALECYRQAYALKDLSPNYRQMLLRQMASLQRQMDDPDAARQTYEQLLAQLTDLDDRLPVLFALVDLETHEGLTDQALDRLRKALPEAKNSPLLPELYQRLVRLQAQTGDLKAADATAREAWKRFPERLDVIWTLVRAYEEAQQYNEAANLLQEIILRQPQSPEVFQQLYDLRRQQEKLPDLVKWLNTQARTYNLETIWLDYLAQLWEWENDAEAALRVREQIVQRRPTNPQVLTAAGHAALRAKSYDLAAKWFEQALGITPEDESLVEALGEVQLARGNRDLALATWKQGLKYRPADPQSTQRLARLLMAHELYDEAAKLYQEGRTATATPTLFAADLSLIYERLGDIPAAVREYLTALTPQNGRAARPERLYDLAEKDEARAAVIATLSAVSPDKLPFDALAVLVYARALDGTDLDEALRPLLTAPQSADRTPNLNSLLMRLAARFEQNERPRPAMQCYRRLLTGQPTSDYTAGIALRLAELLNQTGEWQESLKTLQALDLKLLSPPLVSTVAFEIGDLLLRRAHRPTDAIGAFELALQKSDTGRTALRARWGQADGLFALGKYEDALASYEQLLTHEVPDEPDYVPGAMPRHLAPLPAEDYAAYQQAEALFRQARPEAEADFRRLAAEHPASPHANDALERVLLLQKMKTDAPAAAAIREAIIASDRGDSAKAEQLLTSLTSPALGDEALLLLARLQLEQGNRPTAIATLDRLAATFPKSTLAPQALYLAAMTNSLDNRPETLRRLQALIATYPDAPVAEEAQIALRAWSSPQ